MNPLELDQAAATADVWPPILSVDPGSQHTGVCYRLGQSAIEAVTVEAPARTGDHREAVAYARLVAEIADSLVDRHEIEIRAEAERRGLHLPPPSRTAVETLVPPTGVNAKGRRAAVAPSILADLPIAATVLGHFVGRHPSTILVAPRGGGRGGWEGLPREVYPAELIDRMPAGWLKGGCERKHQRSAWAIAGVAHSLAAQAAPASAPSAPVEPPSDPSADLRSLVEQVVGQVVAARPDPGSAESVLVAVQHAVLSVPNSEALNGREAALCAACLPDLLGCSAAECREQAERLRAEAVVLLAGQVKA